MGGVRKSKNLFSVTRGRRRFWGFWGPGHGESVPWAHGQARGAVGRLPGGGARIFFRAKRAKRLSRSSWFTDTELDSLLLLLLRRAAPFRRSAHGGLREWFRAIAASLGFTPPTLRSRGGGRLRRSRCDVEAASRELAGRASGQAARARRRRGPLRGCPGVKSAPASPPSEPSLEAHAVETTRADQGGVTQGPSRSQHPSTRAARDRRPSDVAQPAHTSDTRGGTQSSLKIPP